MKIILMTWFEYIRLQTLRTNIVSNESGFDSHSSTMIEHPSKLSNIQFTFIHKERT